MYLLKPKVTSQVRLVRIHRPHCQALQAGTGPIGHPGPGPEVCVQQGLGEISGIVRLILIIRRCVREQDLYPSEDWWLIQS